tara:strand:+ start:959 stop:1792 length:834 start_codon:yes stop_codon:yes gene_type:complete
MFKKYGLLGILIIVLVELNFFFKVEPFASWYFPIIWFGYILVLDALVYKLKGSSLISNKPYVILGMFVMSSLFWFVFEIINLFIGNWSYSGLDGLGGASFVDLFGLLSFGTVLPAFFETVELIKSVHLFDKKKLKRSFKISKGFLHGMMFIGVLCFVAPLVLPAFTFPLVWLSFFFILDPINYLHKQPSVVGHLKDKRLVIPLSLLLAGIIMGFFWEFWNYWAVPKWTYDVPFVGFFKVFEMPILGYLGYFPFAFELYAMYWFVRSLFLKKERYLVR